VAGPRCEKIARDSQFSVQQYKARIQQADLLIGPVNAGDYIACEKYVGILKSVLNLIDIAAQKEIACQDPDSHTELDTHLVRQDRKLIENQIATVGPTCQELQGKYWRKQMQDFCKKNPNTSNCITDAVGPRG
jgi:hypothetical protein